MLGCARKFLMHQTLDSEIQDSSIDWIGTYHRVSFRSTCRLFQIAVLPREQTCLLDFYFLHLLYFGVMTNDDCLFTDLVNDIVK